jgi:signal transduction histidine kinase
MPTGLLKQSRLLYAIVGAFAVVALAFILSSVATFQASREIDTSSEDLLGNALPSVMELMRARTAQRRLDVDVDVMSRTRNSRGELLDELVNARADLDEKLRAAMSTPYYPGERALYNREVVPRLSLVDQHIEELRSAVASSPVDDEKVVATVAALSAAGNDLDDALASLAELNHVYAFDAASRIVRTREQSVRLMFWLGVASSMVALFAAAVAVAGASRFAQNARALLERENERAGELDVLAQRVAHDLLSPLAAVSLSLGNVARAHPDPDTARAVDRANRALERTRQMVSGIYGFSKAGARPVPGAAAPLRATVLEAVDEQLAAETKSPPTVDVQDFEEVEVAMDHAVLGVVLSNLLSNAFKFTRDSAVRVITVRATPTEDRMHVEIEDTGPGVSPGLESAIFEPYRRAPGLTQPGLGLGLATVKRVVLAHGGALGVRRAGSDGSVFWFEVPRAPESRAAEPYRRARIPAEAGGAPPLH